MQYKKSVHFHHRTTMGKEHYAKVNITHVNMVLKTKFSQISQQINIYIYTHTIKIKMQIKLHVVCLIYTQSTDWLKRTNMKV